MKLLFLTLLLAVPALAQLPLELKPGTRIALIGNSLFDRMRDDGQFEALMHQRFAKEKLVFRNLSWSADEVALRPRPDGFGDLNQHLTEHQADVILAAFGFNESFKGEKGLAEFETLLKACLIELKSHRYNGTSEPKIVLVSPTAAEKLHEHLNAQIKLYSAAMKKVAAVENVAFADVFTNQEPAQTTNGVHLNTAGYAAFAERLYNQLTQETPPKLNEAVRAVVVEKEDKFFQHYRPLNYFYIKGGRMEPYGVVNFPGELKKLLQMVENRDSAIWKVALSLRERSIAQPNEGKSPNADSADKDRLKLISRSEMAILDAALEPLPIITGDRPINE